MNGTLFRFALACVVGGAISAAEPFDTHLSLDSAMSREDFKSTGISKLTGSERAALERWIVRFTASQSAVPKKLDQDSRSEKVPPQVFKPRELPASLSALAANDVALDSEIAHWQAQLAAIRAGRKWVPLVLDEKGNVTLGEPQDCSPQDQATVIEALSKAHQYKADISNKLQQLRSNANSPASRSVSASIGNEAVMPAKHDPNVNAAGIIVAQVEEKRLPYELSPKNYDLSASNYDNSVANYDNSDKNYDNSDKDYDNSPNNYDNGVNGDRSILVQEGGKLIRYGYYVTNKNGITNFYSTTGRRLFFSPKNGSGVYHGEKGFFCGVIAKVDGTVRLALTETGMKVLLGL